ncbi:MAG: hypothetical protein K6G24_13715 [Lachnospiraceae bacterium]|nr:hypothetical protein [Lachnospiraceae bacterium]
MGMWFDMEGFKNYYWAKSKYAKKKKIVDDFEEVWQDLFHSSLYKIATRGVILDWNHNQQLINDKLLGKGHTIAGVNGMLKLFVDWTNM